MNTLHIQVCELCSTSTYQIQERTDEILVSKGNTVVHVHIMKTFGRVEILIHAFLTSEQNERWVVSFTPRPLKPLGNRSNTH